MTGKAYPRETAEPTPRSHPNPEGIGFSRSVFIKNKTQNRKASKLIMKLSVWNYLVLFCKAKFGGGITSVIEYLLNLFNEKVLSKVSPEELKKYSGIVVALAEFCEKVLDLYMLDEAKRTALTKTVEALCALADSLSDGKVTPDELNKVIDEVVAAIAAWKDARNIQLKPTVVEEAAPEEPKPLSADNAK